MLATDSDITGDGIVDTGKRYSDKVREYRLTLGVNGGYLICDTVGEVYIFIGIIIVGIVALDELAVAVDIESFKTALRLRRCEFKSSRARPN